MSFLTGFHVVAAPRCPQGGSLQLSGLFSQKKKKKVLFFFKEFLLSEAKIGP